MRKSTKLLAAVAFAGLAAAGGSAFTATSTIDQASKQIGATSQSISGVAVTSVSYTWDAATDATSGVNFTIGAPLGTNDTLTVKLNSTASTTPCTVTDTAVACTWTPAITNAGSLSIVVN
jgi:hypothetical protein